MRGGGLMDWVDAWFGGVEGWWVGGVGSGWGKCVIERHKGV